MYGTALISGIRKDFRDGFQHPQIFITDNQAYTSKPTFFQPYKERTPALTILFHTFRSSKNFPAVILTNADRNQEKTLWISPPDYISDKHHPHKHSDSSRKEGGYARFQYVHKPFLLGLLIVPGDTLVPHNASVIFSTRQTETPARYISINASSTEDSLRRYRSIMAVLKGTPLSLGTFNSTSPLLYRSSAYNSRNGNPGGWQNTHIFLHGPAHRLLCRAEHLRFLPHCCGQDPLNRALY